MIRRRLTYAYHYMAALALYYRYFMIAAICRDCHFDDESGIDILCDKHHDKLFLLECKAVNHFDHSL